MTLLLEALAIVVGVPLSGLLLRRAVRPDGTAWPSPTERRR